MRSRLLAHPLAMHSLAALAVLSKVKIYKVRSRAFAHPYGGTRMCTRENNPMGNSHLPRTYAAYYNMHSTQRLELLPQLLSSARI